MRNIDPDTGVRYGIVSVSRLDPEVIYPLIDGGEDLTTAEAVAEIRKQLAVEAEGREFSSEAERSEWFEAGVARFCEGYECEEPVVRFERDGVVAQTTWLGGAQLLWVFRSPHTARRSLCSPCVPGAVDLDSPESEDGHEGYDVPPSWRSSN